MKYVAIFIFSIILGFFLGRYSASTELSENRIWLSYGSGHVAVQILEDKIGYSPKFVYKADIVANVNTGVPIAWANPYKWYKAGAK